jgi:hypothetical protein
MNVHSDASYLSESEARSRACGHFFMGWSPKDGYPIRLNGAFFTLCAILCFVVASAVEAELSALFLNCKEGMIFRMMLENWDIRNLKHQSIATTPRPLALRTIPSNASVCDQWKCDIFGCVIKLHRMHTMSNGTPGKRILPIIKASTISGHITEQSNLGTCTTNLPPWYSPGQTDLAL